MEAQNKDTVKGTIVFRFARFLTCARPLCYWSLAALLLAGCVDVDGGAIEASWVLRTFDGRGISDCGCSQPEITRVRFVVRSVSPEGTVGDDVCAGRPGCEFPCHRQRGATPFFVPARRYAISFAPLDNQGMPLTGARVPAPILRDVEFGRPTQLDAISIESACSAACNGDQGNKVCSRN